MKASDAFKLAATISWFYGNNFLDSKNINTEIANTLGSELYKKFCEQVEIQASVNRSRYKKTDQAKNFSPDFSDNSLQKKYCISDRDVCDNYSLKSIFNALEKVFSL